jgi:hypothetical protein
MSTWPTRRAGDQISVVIEPGASPIHARMRASLAALDEGTFTEGSQTASAEGNQVKATFIA